jgi:N-acyl amino acid synthase of PEP-CTERM/exosortase system
MTVSEAFAPESLVSTYNEHFDVVRASTPSLLDEAFRLRYQVYCVENPFENPAEQVDGRETDVDDDRSVHSLLIHRRSGMTAGTVRVILPDAGRRPRPLPIHKVTRSPLLDELPPHEMGEISRFAVSKEFRCRLGESRYADIGALNGPSTYASERRVVPYITFGLIRGVLETCLEYQIKYISAVMEPALIRLLSRIGLVFEPIGDAVRYHGLRQPCVARLGDLVERSRRERAPLWQYAGEKAFRPVVSSPALAEAVIVGGVND